jgi:antitoxin MazE
VDSRKPVLAQLGLANEVEMEVENDTVVLRRPKLKVREGWAEASQALADSDDDALVMGEFPNADDADLTW